MVHLQQILYNLLGNAIKFSKTEAPVELRIELESASGEENEEQNETMVDNDSLKEDQVSRCPFDLGRASPPSPRREWRYFWLSF
jgi:signal transduction histidine kinase